jgi:hypothetical protein
MNSIAWTLFCGVTGKSHENLIQCSDCKAKNPRVFPFISSTTPVRREVIDLIDSSPSHTQAISSCTEAAVSVPAPKFASYNRESGAEAHRQAHFSQRAPSFPSVRNARRQTSMSSSVTLTSYRATVTFSLLHYEYVDGLSQTISHHVFGSYD